MKFATRALHVGHEPDAATGAVIVPIAQTSTYKQDGIDKPRGGYEYARTQNPTRGALEATLASLEGATHGLSFGSGSAATAAMVNLLEPGDEFISTTDVYGGTYRQLKMVFEKYGVVSHFLNSSSADDVLARVNDKTRMIWVETPTNPMLNVIDITAVAKGKPQDVILAVDNTFATPFFQQPLALGADAVVHSATKYMAGHSDVVSGAIMTSRDDIHDSCNFYRNAVGNVPGPFDCFLVHRGMKTLAVRMQQHDANARTVAGFLAENAKVERVFYPGLPDHPGHAIAKSQMTGFSGMVSFELLGGRSERDRFLDRLQIFMLAESLGGVESLICYPAGMTHASIPEAERNAIGITDRLLRLSVGIEHVDDLIADLDRAIG
jgi:cystathionine beta-lyase/cystathionine gamma-synthase